MKAKYIFIILILTNFNTLANIKTDTIKTNFIWNKVLPYNLSKDNKWLYVNQISENTPKKLSAFYINTNTKEKVQPHRSVTKETDLLYNNIVVAIENNTLTFNDLDYSNNNSSLENVVSYKTIPHNNKTIVLTNDNKLLVLQVNKGFKKNEVLFSNNSVTNYLLSPDGNHLLYQVDNSNKELYYQNIETLKVKRITKLKQNLSSVEWNENAFAIKNNDNSILLCDLATYHIKTIDIDKGQIDRLKIEFFPNNDLYIEYNLLMNKTFTESTFIDIWNGNTKFLYPNNFNLKHQIKYKAFVYNFKTNNLKELERRRDKLYLNIGKPGYILTYNPFEHDEFQSSNKVYQLSILNLQTNEIEAELTPTRGLNLLNISKNNKHLLYPTTENGIWSIYTFKTKKFFNFKTTPFWVPNINPTWSEDSKKIYFQQDNNLAKLNIDNHRIDILTNLNTNNNRINIISNYNYSQNNLYLNDSKPMLFISLSSNYNSFFSLANNSMDLLYTTSNLIKAKQNTFYNPLEISVSFTEENFYMPPVIKYLKNNKVNTLYTSDIPKELYDWRKITKFDFQDKFGEILNGFLTYPKDFDSKKKYPMIIEVYDTFGNLDKQFASPISNNDVRINSTSFNEKGYFVCKLNTYVSEEGPGLSAVDIILKGLDKVLSIEPSINPNKVGLFGFSFGGYKTSFIATKTNRFSTIVSGGASHDIIGGQAYRYSRYRQIPDWGMSENAQMQLKDSYRDNPTKYHDNSPLLSAQHVNTPMLLYAGLKDQNVPPENTEKMFIALLKYKKPVIALFYKNVEHGFSTLDKEESQDFEQRLLDWFEYHLKDNKTIKWISDGLSPNQYTFSKLDDF